MGHNDNDFLTLQKVYANVYNEIVKPDQVFVCTQYFRRRWMPLLGPKLAWLIITLRQHCYWNRQTGELRDYCTIDQEELAAEAGTTVPTLKRLLKQQYADLFVLEVKHRYRYDSKLRKQVRQNSRYKIRMDDPLVPEDERRLKVLLQERLQGLSVDPETGQIDMLDALDRLSDISLTDQPLNLNRRSETNKPEINQAVDALAEQLGRVLTGSNGYDYNGNGVDQKKQNLKTLPYHAARPVSQENLPRCDLKTDEVLVWWDEAFYAIPMTEVVKHDIQLCDGLLNNAARTECYYSIDHALGDESEEWQPAELARIEAMEKLEQDLSSTYQRLAAFSLEEALTHYFEPKLVKTMITGISTEEVARLENWVAYTRRTKGLKNPAGFLRSRIENGEMPPVFEV